MTESSEANSVEKKIVAVDGWVGRLTQEGVVGQIDKQLLKAVLENFGANFEISESARESLGKYRNLDRRPGMDAVWGTQRVKEYRIWLRHWVADYEERYGKSLPVLEDSDVKTSGGLKFFTDLTAFVGGEISFDDYKRITEDRVRKGRAWLTRGEGETVPTPHSSFPPGFPNAAWEKIKSWGK